MKSRYKIQCHCGCSILELSQWDEEFIFTHYIMSWEAHQRPILSTIKERLALIWCAITGKEYSLYEVILSNEQFKKYRDHLNSIKV